MSATSILLLGFAIGIAFGAIGHGTRFCTMGAIADIVSMNDWSRMRMWLLAIAVAVLGAAMLEAGGQINLDQSIYRTASLPWLSHLVGGLLFGVGMVLASGCGARTLMRVGAGNLKSLVVFLVLAISAYATLHGILGVLRVNTLDTVTIALGERRDLATLFAGTGLPPQTARAVCALAIGGALAAFCFARRDFLTRAHLLGGFGIGALVVAGWFVTGVLGHLAEHPDTLQEHFVATSSGRMESLSFVAPQAYLLELLMLWSDSSRRLSFSVAVALGVVAGAALMAVRSRSFRWEGFRDVDDLVRHLLGGALMGFGGVTALGCTIGQGISGISTLAPGSFITLAAVIAGAVATLKFTFRRMMRAPQ